MRFFSMAAMVLATSSAIAAGWTSSTQKDEMRDVTHDAATSFDLNEPETKAALVVVKSSNRSYVGFVHAGSKLLSCDPVVCKLLVKFDSGDVHEYPARLSDDRRSIAPDERKRFVRAVQKSSQVLAEVRLAGGEVRQLKFQTKDSPVLVDPDPTPSILKYPLGTNAASIAGFPSASLTSTSGLQCVLDMDTSLLISIPVKANTSACFMNGELANVVVRIPRSRKSDLAAMDRSLDGVYGKPDKTSSATNWPNQDADYGAWHTSATIWRLGNDAAYLLKDNSISDLMPKKGP